MLLRILLDPRVLGSGHVHQGEAHCFRMVPRLSQGFLQRRAFSKEQPGCREGHTHPILQWELKKLLLKKIGTCVHFIILKREGSLFAPSCCSFPQGSTASFLAISFRVCLPGGVCLGGFNSCLTMMADEHVVPLPPTHGSFAPLIW